MFRFLFKTVITFLILFGVFTFAKNTFFNSGENSFFHPAREKCIEKSANILDFKEIDPEFEFVRTGKFPKFAKYAYIRHKGSSQHFLFFIPDNKDFLTKEDFKTEKAAEKIKKMFSATDDWFSKIQNFEVTGKGFFRYIDKSVPFLKFNADTVNLPVKSISGIIAVADNTNNQNVVILIFNETDKYSDIITGAMLSKVKP